MYFFLLSFSENWMSFQKDHSQCSCQNSQFTSKSLLLIDLSPSKIDRKLQSKTVPSFLPSFPPPINKSIKPRNCKCKINPSNIYNSSIMIPGLVDNGQRGKRKGGIGGIGVQAGATGLGWSKSKETEGAFSGLARCPA